VTIVAEHVEFRPEFKKNGAPDMAASIVEQQSADFSVSGMDAAEDIPTLVEELEPVTF
jgi:hypothetical protein